MLNTKNVLNSWETLSEIMRGKEASKFDKKIWGRLMSHIYENPVEIEGV